MKKLELEVLAEYIDWADILGRFNEIISETCKEISSIEIKYEEKEEECET